MTYLCIIDNSQELEAAIQYASKEAKNHQTDVAFLYPIEPIQMQQWAGVEDIMREESRTAAIEAMNKWAIVVENLTSRRPTTYIEEGKTLDLLTGILGKEAISHLVLAAGQGDNPIIQEIVCNAKHPLGVPLTIVPVVHNA